MAMMKADGSLCDDDGGGEEQKKQKKLRASGLGPAWMRKF